MKQILEYTDYKVNYVTLTLFFVFVCGLSLNFYLSVIFGVTFLGVISSVILYNFAFTIWHEAAHNNIFRQELKSYNTVVGFITSFFNLNPGFFGLKHDHLLHHMYTIDEDKDRTHPRLTDKIFGVPFGIIKEMFTRKKYEKNFGIKNESKRKIDRYAKLLFLLFVLITFLLGYGINFLLIFLLPRMIILPIHTVYVCYLPHVNLPKNSEKSTRNLKTNFIIKILTLYHSYHGVHHIYPSIPWNKYEKFYKENLDDINSKVSEEKSFISLFKEKLI